jgi:predicted ArsR family transcriptional regulator
MNLERRDFLKAAAAAGGVSLFGGGCLSCFEDPLRYRYGGELHRDFHASILDGYNYVKDNYGEEGIRQVMERFACGVHRTMHEKLVRGDTSELLEYWRYYLAREGADFSLEETADGGAELTVRRCPAHAHLEKRGIPGAEGLCAATRLFNEELVKCTPFVLETAASGDGGCRQILRRKC